MLLFVFDHNRDHFVAWGDTVYGDKDASKYVDGLAFHWYAGGLNRDLDGAVATTPSIALMRSSHLPNYSRRRGVIARASRIPICYVRKGTRTTCFAF